MARNHDHLTIRRAFVKDTISFHKKTTQQEQNTFRLKKEELKLYLFIDDIVLKIENPIEGTKVLLELIFEFSQVRGYKINIQN